MGLGGVVAAFDYEGVDANVIGGGGSYVFSHIHEENGAGDANANQGYLTVYGTVNGADWYFDLGLWGGYYSSKNRREISFPGVETSAKSTIQGWQLAPHFEVGYDGFGLKRCDLKWFGIEPFLMAEWAANWEGGFKEHGAGNLNMGQSGRFCSLLRAETGLRLNESVSFNWGWLIFREKGSYTYQKAFNTGTIQAFRVGSPGSFSVSALTGAQNLGVIELSLLYLSVNENAPHVAIRYQGEFGSRYQSHQGVLEIGKTF